MATRTHLTLRVDANLPERIGNVAGVVGATNTSEAARHLLELGIAVAEGKLPPPLPRGEPPLSDEDATAVVRYLRRELWTHLDVVAMHRPVGAIAEAVEAGTALVEWAELTAERRGTSLADLLAAVPSEPSA